MNLPLILLLVISSPLVAGHGKIIVPRSRFGDGYENNPIGFGANVQQGPTLPEYICRHESKQHNHADADWTAGQYVTVNWDFSAAHVGDCEGYLSYDYGKPRAEMNWIKIANWPDCRADNNVDVNMKLPSWLPEGKAVFRFHWYALHVRPSLEFYVQCSDVSIHSEQQGWPTGLIPFKLQNPTLFPTDGPSYRDAFNTNIPIVMTGPSCSSPNGYSFTDNDCELTGPNTANHLEISQGDYPTIVPLDGNNGGNDDNNDDNGGNDDNNDDNGGNDDNNDDNGGNDDNNDDNGGNDDNNDDHHNNDPTICPTNTYVSTSPAVPDSWCQTQCTWYIPNCDPDFCVCEGGFEPYVPVPDPKPQPSSGTDATWRVIYLDWRLESWGNLYNDIKRAADSGFNVIILAFHMGVDPTNNAENVADAAQVWRDMTDEQKQTVKTYLATKNARLLVSLGGEAMSFEAEIERQSAQSLCTKVAQFAIDHQFDGVDVDMELEPAHSTPFEDGTAIDWLVTCTKALRTTLGDERLISHAPLAPYFGTWAGDQRGYIEVYKQAPTINILNVQYYNQGDWVYTTYHDLFVENTIFPGTAVKELMDAGIPEDKIVIGKPLYDGDASNGHVDPVELRSWASKACTDFGWSAGFMGWQYRPEFTSSSFASELTNPICTEVAITPLLGAKLTVPLAFPQDQGSQGEEDTPVNVWVIFACVFGGLCLVALIGYFLYRRSSLHCNVYKSNLIEESNYENMNKV